MAGSLERSGARLRWDVFHQRNMCNSWTPVFITPQDKRQLQRMMLATRNHKQIKMTSHSHSMPPRKRSDKIREIEEQYEYCIDSATAIPNDLLWTWELIRRAGIQSCLSLIGPPDRGAACECELVIRSFGRVIFPTLLTIFWHAMLQSFFHFWC